MSSEFSATLTRPRVLPVAGLVAAAVLAGCSTTTPVRVADRDCPERRPALYAALDVSDSARSDELTSARLSGVEDLVTDAAICAGRVKVVAFTASASATEVLLERDLVPEGATRRAQLRRVPLLVEEAMDEVRTDLVPAAERLPAGGTDVVAQLGLAGEFHRQIGTDRPLRIVVWSDGVASSPVDLNIAGLDVPTAVAQAERVEVPRLDGVDVTVAGVGRPGGALPPTGYVDALKAFYGRVCERSGASCTVVSDITTAVAR